LLDFGLANKRASRNTYRAVTRVTLANFPSKQDAKAPPEGLLWGDGELGAARRRAVAPGSPDVKGVFGEGASVVAVPPMSPPATRSDAAASLFAGGQAAPALAREAHNDTLPSAERPVAKNRGLWSGDDAGPLTPPLAGLVHNGTLPRAVVGALPYSGAAARVPIDATPTVGSTFTPVESAAGETGSSLTVDSTPPVVELELEAEPEEDSVRPGATAQPAQRTGTDAPAASIPRGDPENARSSVPAASFAPTSRSARAPSSWRSTASSTRPKRFRAGRWLLALCGALLACVAVLLAGARAGLWSLPPTAATIFGRDARTSAHLPASTHVPSVTTALPATPALAKQLPAEQPLPAAAEDLAKASDNAATTPAPEPANPAPAEQPLPAAAEDLAKPSRPSEPAPKLAEPSAADEPAPAPERAEPNAGDEPAAAAPPSAAAAADQESSAKATASSAKLLQLARAKEQADDLPGAEVLLRSALAKDPDDHHVMEVLVRVLISRGRGSEAVKYAEEIVHKRPKRANYRLIAGDAKLLAGDKIGAEREWREALALEPGNREARRRLSAH